MTVRTKRAQAADTAGAQVETGPSTSFARMIHRLAELSSGIPGVEQGRLQRAVELILHPDVHERCWMWDKTDGYQTLHIRGSRGQWHRVNGACTCRDYQVRGGFCKHRLARKLLLAAEVLMEREAGAHDTPARGHHDRDTALPVQFGRGKSKMWKE